MGVQGVQGVQDEDYTDMQEMLGLLQSLANTGRGTGYKQLSRWDWFMDPRLDTEGRPVDSAEQIWTAYEAYIQSPAQARQRAAAAGTGQWSFLGPTEYELVTPAAGNHLFTGGLGRVNTVAFHPTAANTIFVGSATGGLWKSTDGGARWTPMTDRLPSLAISSIAIDPSGTVLYLLSGDGEGRILPSIGVLRSTDSGATWTRIGPDFGQAMVYGYKLAMQPGSPSTLIAVTTQGLYRTTDGGGHWTLVQTGSFRDLEYQPGNPGVVYASTETGVFRSADSGQTWAPVQCGLPPSIPAQPPFDALSFGNRVALAVSPASPSTVYALFGGSTSPPGTFTGLFRSDNGGQCFTLRSNQPDILSPTIPDSQSLSHPWYDLALTVAPDDANQVYVGAINNWKSLDGGTTWILTSFWLEDSPLATVPYVHPDTHELAFNGTDLYASNDGGIYKTADRAATWTDLSKGLAITEIFRICGTPAAPGLVYFGAQDNGANRLNGATAVQVYGGDSGQCQIDPASSNFIFVSSQFGVLNVSQDAGSSFLTTNPSQSTGYITPFRLAPAALIPNQPNVLFGCYTDLWMLTLVFGAPTWSNLSNGQLGTATCAAVAVSPSSPAILYVAKPAGVFQSTNGGVTWQLRSGIWPVSGPEITDLAVHPSDPLQVAITLSGYWGGQKVYLTRDGGATWSNISGSLPNVQGNTIVFDGTAAGGLYVGMEVGVYYRDSTLSDWVPYFDGLPNVIVNDLDIQTGTGKIRAGTYGRGVWESPLYPRR